MKKLNIIFALIILIGSFLPDKTFAIAQNQAAEIKKVLIEHTKAMDKHDIEKVKTFYDEEYRSADGFDINDLTGMLEKTYKAYQNIKYKSKINNISAYDNWALVEISDKSYATVNPDEKNKDKEKMGLLEGKSVYNVYLKKDKDQNWKIYRDDILMEETSLKYGIANKMDINLITPIMVKPNEKYNLFLKMNKPDDVIALGSISREEITYPPKDYPEKFRKIPQEGELERIVTANDKNLDEYAIASVGFTRISMDEEKTRAKIEILGMAYILKRVNLDPLKDFNKDER